MKPMSPEEQDLEEQRSRLSGHYRAGSAEEPPAHLDAAILTAARATGTALEINAQPERLDLNDVMARRAKDAGVMLALCTDSHSREDLSQNVRYGLGVARRAWVEPAHLLNTRPLAALTAWISRKRNTATS